MMKVTENGILIKLKVIPNASKNCIICENTEIKVKITASPVDNKANIALTEFLSKQLGVSKSNIEIVKGVTSKDKTIFLKVTDKKSQDSVLKKLQEYSNKNRGKNGT